MKLAYSSVFLFFLTTSSIFAADDAEIQEGGSLFGRSALFFNALCLPLFDGCNARSTVGDCTNDGEGDACSGGDSCVKTTERGVVCASYGDGPGANCTKSRDCARGYVL